MAHLLLRPPPSFPLADLPTIPQTMSLVTSAPTGAHTVQEYLQSVYDSLGALVEDPSW